MALFTKRLLLFLLFALVLLPVLQAKFHFFKEKKLGGAYSLTSPPKLTWEALQANSFQPELEKYLEEQMGFRPLLVRLRNQLAFSLFRTVHSSGIAVGRHDVLYELFQVQSYAGQDLMAEAAVRREVKRLRLVQRDLAQRGVQLLFVMAPNKARFQPEDLPAALQVPTGTLTNYDLYVRALTADTVTMLNMVPLFARWKKTTPFPLFVRAGTHWSGYGATLAADTLLRRLEQLGHMRFPTVRTVGNPVFVHSTDSLRGSDNDLARPLNILQQAEAIPAAYRQLAFDPPQPGQTRPPALFVGDSFTWGFSEFSPYLTSQFAADSRLWYYGNAIHLPNAGFTYTDTLSQNLSSSELRKAIESRKFIVLVITEHNLVKKEFGFTNRLYRLYHPHTPAENQAIDQLTHKMMEEAAAKNPDAAWVEEAKDGHWELVRAQAEDAYEKQHGY